MRVRRALLSRHLAVDKVDGLLELVERQHNLVPILVDLGLERHDKRVIFARDDGGDGVGFVRQRGKAEHNGVDLWHGSASTLLHCGAQRATDTRDKRVKQAMTECCKQKEPAKRASQA